MMVVVSVQLFLYLIRILLNGKMQLMEREASREGKSRGHASVIQTTINSTVVLLQMNAPLLCAQYNHLSCLNCGKHAMIKSETNLSLS